jgi:hypothetical protein
MAPLTRAVFPFGVIAMTTASRSSRPIHERSPGSPSLYSFFILAHHGGDGPKKAPSAMESRPASQHSESTWRRPIASWSALLVDEAQRLLCFGSEAQRLNHGMPVL